MGPVVLAVVLAVVFWLTYTLASPVVGWLEGAVVATLAAWAKAALATTPAWLNSLVSAGLFGGVGTVVTFLPILVVFFAVIGALEDTGYLARAAYVMDRFMHWLGLHGRSFFPLCLGFGRNVPAVLGTRILDDRQSRLLTILMTPFVPCTGRMAVVAFLAPAFFGRDAAAVTYGLVLVNLVTIALVGRLVQRLILRDTLSAFIMEMPLYHLPNARTIGLFVWHNTWAFVKKAGTIILALSIVVWTLAALPDGRLEHSWLAALGRALTPIGQVIGVTDWRLIAALLTGFVAKESTIATLGVLYSTGNEGGLASQVSMALSPAAALAFLTVQMLFIPCVATLSVMRQETGGWRWPLFSVAIQLLLALAISATLYQLAQAF